MKKVFVILSACCCIAAVACGGGEEKKNPETEARAEEAKEQVDPVNEDYEKGLDLVAKSDCFTCHKVNEASVGPAYQDVANKYANNDAVIDTLSNKIIAGGSGNWGPTAMIPHPSLSKDDAKTMVKYIMSLKK